MYRALWFENETLDSCGLMGRVERRLTMESRDAAGEYSGRIQFMRMS